MISYLTTYVLLLIHMRRKKFLRTINDKIMDQIIYRVKLISFSTILKTAQIFFNYFPYPLLHLTLKIL